MKFCLGIHNHQPVGNFDWVIEKIHRESYRPFLQAMHRHPNLPFSLHLSGVLIDWLVKHDPALLRLIKQMTGRGQLEIVGGAYFEPILPAIPRADRIAQIKMYQKEAKKRFGVTPKGFWLAERVWEPDVAADLAECGVEYTVLDDRHFLITGLAKSDLKGYFVTESDGAYLKIFPIDMKSRFLIPFKPVSEVEAHLRQARDAGREGFFYFDDGEKFGSWPGTSDWVYRDGWMNDFLSMLERLKKDFLKVTTYGEAAKSMKPCGILYPPSASYPEMEDWALPALAFNEIQKYRSQFNLEYQEQSPFVRGSIWKNFLVKYPESNRMHKTMLDMSKTLAAKGGAGDAAKALKDLYQAQCNDAYWHGIFGGLYLPHLRDAIWSHLASVRAYLNRALKSDKITVASMPSGEEAAFWEGKSFSGVWLLAHGGFLSQLMHLARKRNILNTLARHAEGYHAAIHERITELKEGIFSHLGSGDLPFGQLFSGCDGKMPCDGADRGAFMDRIFELSDASERDFKNACLPALSPADARFTVSGKKLLIHYRDGSMQVSKTIVRKGLCGFEVAYRVKNAGTAPAAASFGTEINFYLAVCQPESLGPDSVTFRDSNTGIRVTLEADNPGGIWHYDVKTKHLSEQGFNETYQGTCVMPFWKLYLEPGETFETTVVFSVD